MVGDHLENGLRTQGGSTATDQKIHAQGMGGFEKLEDLLSFQGLHMAPCRVEPCFATREAVVRVL